MRATVLWLVVAANICQAAINPFNQQNLKEFLEDAAPFDFILIDVRGSRETTTVIGNAACKPYNLEWPEQFKSEVAKIPKDQPIVVYCQSGGRSRAAAMYLSDSGYTRVYDAGGFKTWTGPTIPGSEIKPLSFLPEPSMAKADTESTN